jgi:death-on-curing protein
MEPHFLDISQVIAIHDNQVARHGGALGIRDQGGLEAAVFQAQRAHFDAVIGWVTTHFPL